jgi:hypothetical protein
LKLLASDGAIDDLLYVAKEALDKHIITLDEFLKYTRALTREQFLVVWHTSNTAALATTSTDQQQ